MLLRKQLCKARRLFLFKHNHSKRSTLLAKTNSKALLSSSQAIKIRAIKILRSLTTVYTYMHISHPAFTLPLDLDSKIWQYMELAEFVSMLHRKALFFVKANKLRDPYEGIIPQFNNVLTSTIHAIEREKEKEKQVPYNADKVNLVSPSIPQAMIQQFQVYR